MSSNLLKRRWITGPAIALAALLGGFFSPASAAQAVPPGTGVVTGIVNSSGVPLTPPPPGTVNCNSAVNVPPTGKNPPPTVSTPFSGLGTTFGFNSTVITGTVNVGNNDIASGSVAVTANGAGCDNADFGHGTVNATCAAIVGVVIVGPKGPGANANITCNLNGTYDRVGTHVWVNLRGSICINAHCSTIVKVDVQAEFIPITVAPCAGYPQCATSAVFSGTYVQSET